LSQYAFLVKFVIFLFMMAYFWFHTIPNTIPHLDQDPKTPFNVEFRSSSPFNGSRVTHDGMAPMMAGTDAHPAGVDPGGADWIGACRKGTIPAVYPNSSEARTAHMQTVLARIGGCGRLVQAVMRDHVTTRTTPDHRKQALYGTDVIFNTLDTATPKGNLPNAATHFRMVNELANTKASTAESTWTLFFEDDAQLHADVALLYVSVVASASALHLCSGFLHGSHLPDSHSAVPLLWSQALFDSTLFARARKKCEGVRHL
jgi:hypothetical protein